MFRLTSALFIVHSSLAIASCAGAAVSQNPVAPDASLTRSSHETNAPPPQAPPPQIHPEQQTLVPASPQAQVALVPQAQEHSAPTAQVPLDLNGQTSQAPQSQAQQGPPAVQTPASVQTPTPVQTPPNGQTPPAPAPAVDPEFDAASALKKKAAYVEAGAAFEAWAAVHPNEPRTAEAFCEAAVCWNAIGRTQLKNLRNTPESRASFEKSLALFDKALKLGGKDQGGRAQYMRGWVKFSLDDPEGALAEFDLVPEKWKDDAKYVPKALERHAMVQRCLLRTAGAISDLQRYIKAYPQGEDIEAVKAYLSYCTMFDKPSPPLRPETWVQGDPTTLQAMRGDVVLLYFFATWCPHCEEARPAMIDLAEHYGPIGVHVIGVLDHSQGQTPESVKAILPVKDYKFPVMMDNGGTYGQFHGSKIPDVVLIDRAGRVRWHDNANNLHDSSIETLLLEDPPPALAKPAK